MQSPYLRAAFAAAAMILLAVPGRAHAQAGAGPQPLPSAAPIPQPADRPFPGTMHVDVDATDAAHKVFHVHESIPVAAGPLVLLYPQWDIGSHAATGQINAVAGIVIHGAGSRIAWHRDAVDTFAFHVDVPSGVTSLDVDFDFISPLRRGEQMMTYDIVTVAWNGLVLYPAGWFARDIPVAAHLRLPSGFHAMTSLTGSTADPFTFATVSLETLTDSPVYGGRYVRVVPLVSRDGIAVKADLVADAPEDLQIAPALVGHLQRLIAETHAIFPGNPFPQTYAFLISLSDALPSGGGTEHRTSSEVTLSAHDAVHPENDLLDQDLIAHEYVHAWNGFVRTPADLWTANLNEPMRDSMLWMYEGQTEFWAEVLAARSQTQTRDETLDAIAADAAEAQNRTGRAWKSLQESSLDPLYDAGKAVVYRDWQRREDYYAEGVLLWLDADMTLRERTHDRASLADFARAFFAVTPGSLATRTYSFTDVCAALNAVAPYDWTSFFRTRLDANDGTHVLDGLTRAGYRLIYTPVPSTRTLADQGDGVDAMYSIGLDADAHGSIARAAWDGPAFRAGIAPGAHLLTVNGKAFTPDVLRTAIAAAAAHPISVTYTADGQQWTRRIDYTGTLRYPHLERIPGTADRLGALLSPAAR